MLLDVVEVEAALVGQGHDDGAHALRRWPCSYLLYRKKGVGRSPRLRSTRTKCSREHTADRPFGRPLPPSGAAAPRRVASRTRRRRARVRVALSGDRRGEPERVAAGLVGEGPEEPGDDLRARRPGPRRPGPWPEPGPSRGRTASSRATAPADSPGVSMPPIRGHALPGLRAGPRLGQRRSAPGDAIPPVVAQVGGGGGRRATGVGGTVLSAASRKATANVLRWSSRSPTAKSGHGVGSASWSSPTATDQVSEPSCGGIRSIIGSSQVVRHHSDL